MFLNLNLDSGLSVIILDFSDMRFVSFKIYNVTRNLYEYSNGPSTLSQNQFMYQISSQYLKRRQRKVRKTQFSKGQILP